jgi:iron complex outermembrane recepter protein
MGGSKIEWYALLRGVCGTVVLTAACVNSSSLSAAPASDQSVAAVDGDALSEIVVTAQRRSESLQKVPISVVALQPETLESFGPLDTKALAKLVPGLEFHTSAGAGTLYLRGVGFSSAQVGIDSPVGLYVDGVYQPVAQANIFALNNLERVEVLKGPQGTLFGRNTSGGVVHLITRDPSETPHFDGTIGYGNYDTPTLNLYGTTGIGGGVAADLAISALNQGEGWGKNITLNKDDFKQSDVSIRSKLKWADDLTDVMLTTAYYHGKQNLAGFALVPGRTGAGGFGNVGFYNVALNIQPELVSDKYDATLRASHEFELFKVNNILAYQNVKIRSYIDLDFTPLALVDQKQFTYDSIWTEELQFLSAKESRINWIAGYYLFDEAASTNFKQFGGAFAARGGGVTTLSSLDTVSNAGYGQATANLFESTRLTLGARYTSDNRHILASVTPVTGAVAFPDQQKTWNKFTWRTSLDHDFARDVLGYLSFNRGFKSGGYSINNPTLPSVNPETLDAYEVGLKTQLFNGHLRLNTAAFYYDYTNLQFRSAVGNVQLLLNAKAARVYGLDSDFLAQATRNISINGGIEILNAKFTDYKNALISVLPATGTGPATFVVGDVSGNFLPQSPRFSMNLGVNYKVDLGSGGLVFATTGKYTSTVPWDPDNRLKSPGKVLVDASVKWLSADARYDVTFFGSNLFSKKYYDIALATVSGDAYAPAPPRTYGIRLGMHL